MIKNDGTYLNYPTLAASELPTLVRQQRRLEAKIAPLEGFVPEEKAVRDRINQLLVAAGLENCDKVTVNGYEVAHYDRAGQSAFDQTQAIEQLVGAGLERAVVEQIFRDATKKGAPVSYATVNPPKGAQVRRPAA
jgi:hypothetical protein